MIGSIRLWHGSPFLFDQFSLAHVGKGEGGNGLGFGCYLSEDERVAERFARYAEKIRGRGYLYDVFLNIGPGEMLELNTNGVGQSDVHGTIDYYLMLQTQTHREVAANLVNLGIKVVKCYEEDDRGYIILCVQPEHLKIFGRKVFSNGQWNEER